MDNNENKRFEDYSDPRVTNLNGQPYHSASENDGKPFSERGYESAANQGYGGANYNYGSGYEGQSGYADQNGYAGQNRYAGQNGYTDYNGYAQRGNVPLDKKGRPLQNRYGLKLTLSIIEIVFGILLAFCGGGMGMLPLVLAVLACVYTCRQNRDFQIGDWDGFLKKSKIATIFLWISFGIDIALIVFIIVLLVCFLTVGSGYLKSIVNNINLPSDLNPGSSYEYEIDDSEDKEDTDSAIIADAEVNDLEGGYVDLVEGFNSFRLMGADITLPMPVQDFMEAGFYLQDEDLDEMTEANNSYGYAYYSRLTDEYLGTLFIYNTSSKDQKVQDGIIGGITVNGYDNVDLALVGGLGFGTTLADAVDVFGADVTEAYIDGDYGYYKWLFDHGYSTSIELDYSSGKLNEVWIMKYDTLQDN